MGSNQLYSLTWGEFGTSLVSAVQLLRCHGDLVDVTLAAGGRSFPAHKIVLCAASPFLLNLLKVRKRFNVLWKMLYGYVVNVLQLVKKMSMYIV